MGIFNLVIRFFNTEEPVVTEKKTVESVSATELLNSVFEAGIIKNTASDKTNTCIADTKTIAQVYKSIEEFCLKYNINPAEAKMAKLLEKVSGCTTEELLIKSDEEISHYTKALEDSMSWYQQFTGKNFDDIGEIAKAANKRYIRNMTGQRGFFSEVWKSVKGLITGDNGDLINRLKNAGYNCTPEGVKAYFDDKMRNALQSKDPKKIQEAYDELLVLYGDLLNATDEPMQKELLTAAISHLQANKRHLGVKLGLASCRGDEDAKHAVARGMADNFEDITCQSDAFGSYTTEEENFSIAVTYSKNMSATDFGNHVKSMSRRRNELLNKLNKGEALTEAEERYLNIVQGQEYTANLIGAIQNEYLSGLERSKVLSEIYKDVEKYELGHEVYTSAIPYIEKHPELDLKVEKFVERMNVISHGEFSNFALENIQLRSINKNSIKNNIESNETVQNSVEESTATVEKAPKEYASKPETKEYIEKKYKSFIEASVYGSDGISAYANNERKGVVSLLKEFVSDFQYITNTTVVKSMVKIYEENPELQPFVLKDANGSAMELLLKHTSPNVLENFHGKGSTYWATKQIESARMELRKDKDAKMVKG